MMTLTDILKAVDKLPPDDLRRLREYLDQREKITLPEQELDPKERIHRLSAGFEKMRSGLTQAQLDEMLDAMNEEYIEPVDEDIWRE